MRFTVCMVLACLVASVPRAHAEEEPWAIGITEQQKAQAQKLLEEGNALFLAKNYSEALDKYKAAVGAWDHPAIRFNMVRCLIQLDRAVEASDNLALALKFGAAPMDEAVYNEALSYQKLLANQIGDLDVHCEQPGVVVTLDGKPLLNCPGKEHRRVAPGQHQLVGTKDGFLTKTTEVVVLGAKTEDSKIELVPLGKAAKVVHRWATWVPWTVFGAGLVLAGIGGVIQYQASQDMSSYDSGVTTFCSGTGCAPDDPHLAGINAFKTHAETENKIAVSVMTVGFATAVVGGVMLYMNRGRTVYEASVEKQGPQLGFAPTNAGGVVSLSGHF